MMKRRAKPSSGVDGNVWVGYGCGSGFDWAPRGRLERMLVLIGVAVFYSCQDYLEEDDSHGNVSEDWMQDPPRVEMQDNPQDHPSLDERNLLNKNIIYNTYDMPDENEIWDVCKMSSINNDSIFLAQVVKIGEDRIIDPCAEKDQPYHVPYTEETLEVIALGAGESLPDMIDVRMLHNTSPNAHREDDFLLAYVRKIKVIYYMFRVVFAYPEQEAPALNVHVSIEVPRNFGEFSRQLQIAQRQEDPSCAPQRRTSDEDFLEYLGQRQESCALPLEDE
jgi:hypothetical protein